MPVAPGVREQRGKLDTHTGRKFPYFQGLKIPPLLSYTPVQQIPVSSASGKNVLHMSQTDPRGRVGVGGEAQAAKVKSAISGRLKGFVRRPRSFPLTMDVTLLPARETRSGTVPARWEIMADSAAGN